MKKIYRIPKTKKLIKKLKPYWLEFESTTANYNKEIRKLEKKMAKETGIKDIMFFCYGEGYIGIGTVNRDMQLIHDTEFM